MFVGVIDLKNESFGTMMSIKIMMFKLRLSVPSIAQLFQSNHPINL
jgi:hypothetical protein